MAQKVSHQAFDRGCITQTGCLGDAAVRRRTRDRKVAGSTPGRALSSQLGQLSLPSLRGR